MRRTGELFGREQERGRLLDLVRDGARLLTLLGPAGIGKTRLALEVAAALSRAGRAVISVDLDPIREVDDLAPLVATSAGLRTATHDGLEGLLRALCRRPDAVLLLDNAEHAAEAVAGFALALLHAHGAPPLIVTSQVRLHLAEEVCFELSPVGAAAGRCIFRQTAARVAPGLALKDELVDRVVAGVDGLPLAIELAASRLRYQSLAELAAPDSLPIDALFRGDTSLPPRSRSLKAALRGAWSLLGPEDQAAGLGLAIFEGGFTRSDGLAVLQAAGAADPNVLLDTLRDCSLSWARTWSGNPRQGLFDAVRRYLRAEHEGDPRLDEARARHAAHFEAGAAHAHAAFWGADPAGARRWLAQEQANLRAAVTYLDVAAPRRAAALVGRIAPGLAYSGPKTSQRRWLSKGIEAARRGGASTLEGQLLMERATSCVVRGEYEAAREDLGRAAVCLDHAIQGSDPMVPLGPEAGSSVGGGGPALARGFARSPQSLRAQVDLLLAHVALRLGEFDDAEALRARAERALEVLDDDELRAHALLQRLVFGIEVNPRSTVAAAREVRAWAERTGRARLEGMTWMFEAQAFVALGEWQSSLQPLERAEASYRATETPIYLGLAQAERARAFRGLGQLGEALRQADLGLAEAEDGGDTEAVSFLALARIEALVELGRLQDAAAELPRAKAAMAGVELPGLHARFGGLEARLVERPDPAVVDPDGRAFMVHGRRVDLVRRRAVRRILGRLAVAVAAGADTLAWADLFTAGWPGAPVDEGARHRTYTAIWTLRSLGLAAHLETSGDGYRLVDVEVRPCG